MAFLAIVPDAINILHMLGKKRIKEYLLERFARIRQHHSDFSCFGRQNDLHKFRVETKKVRMVVKLFDYCLKNKLASMAFMPLRKIFKDAGDIRNIHIGIEILEKYKLNNSKAARHKEKEMAQEVRDFAGRQIDHIKAIEEVEHTLIFMADDLDEGVIMEYIEGLLKKSGGNLLDMNNKDGIHKARSIMKLVMYMNDLVNKRLKHELALDIAYINELQEVIGTWHDADLALQELQSLDGVSKKVVRSIEDEVDGLSRQVSMSAANFIERTFTYANH